MMTTHLESNVLMFVFTRLLDTPYSLNMRYGWMRMYDTTEEDGARPQILSMGLQVIINEMSVRSEH